MKDATKDITQPIVLLSGHCNAGVDKVAESIAQSWGWTIDLYPADWSQGLKAGPQRNIVMANQSNLVLCFLHPESKGTLQMVKYCQKSAKPCVVVHVQ